VLDRAHRAVASLDLARGAAVARHVVLVGLAFIDHIKFGSERSAGA